MEILVHVSVENQRKMGAAMDKTFVKLRNCFVNLQTVSYVETTEDGGMSITLTNRDHPVRLSATEASGFQEILGRFLLQARASAAGE